MQYSIDFNLSEVDFRKRIETIIKDCRTAELSLTLPCHGVPIEILALVLGQLDCRNKCQALCCKSPKFAPNGIPLLEIEYDMLKQRFGQDNLDKIKLKLIGNHKYLPTPCPFLKKDNCTIYDIRPVVCVNYPFDPGTQVEDGLVHLDSFCPECRRIVKATFLSLWKLNKLYKSMGPQITEIKDGAKQELELKSIKTIVPPP